MVSPGWTRDSRSREPGRFMVRPLATLEKSSHRGCRGRREVAPVKGGDILGATRVPKFS